jgi:hypothetical protein
VIILLSAFYGQKFTIDSIEQLDRIVKLADYYRALPTFSYALDGAFLRSPALIEAIHVLPHRLIKVAVQLRNEVSCAPYFLAKFRNFTTRESFKAPGSLIAMRPEKEPW